MDTAPPPEYWLFAARYARCTAGVLARLLCEGVIWLSLLIVLLNEVRAIAAAPELALYGPSLTPAADGVPRTVRLIVMRHGESVDNAFPCTSILAPNGVRDPLLTQAGAEEALSAGRALRAAGYSADAVLASTLMRSQMTALLALGSRGICGGTPVHVAPHVAETHWGIAGGCRTANRSSRASRADYRCNAFHPASCNEALPSVQRELLARGQGSGSWFLRCEPGVGLGGSCASALSWELVGGVNRSYCSHADTWGQPNWPQFWSWLWQEQRLWHSDALQGKPEPTLAIVSHGNLMERLLGGSHPVNTGAYLQIVAFGQTPSNGIVAAGSALPGWRCLHRCAPEEAER